MSEPVIWEIAMPGKPTQQFIPLAFHKQKLNALQAELERLRKAGDELVYWVGCDEYPERVITEWKAAKEGKPSV